MTLAWKCGLLLLSSISLHAFADDNTPTDDVIKQQFAEHSDGLMHLGALKLSPLESVGNRATYMVEGDIASNDDLYGILGAAGDYLFYERTWKKDQPVKFSAMMTAVGTRASGWKTEFFSMQMAAKSVGRPFSHEKDLSRALVVNDSGYMAQFARIDAQFAASKTLIQKQQAEYEALKKKLDAQDEKIKRSWGTDENGKQLDRGALQRAQVQQLNELDRKNSFAKFESQYYLNVYEPALAACQKKAGCDSAPIHAARDVVLEKTKEEYYRQHIQLRDKLTAEMAEKDKQLAPLQKERQALYEQMMEVSFSINDLERNDKIWQEGTAKLRKEGVIP
ncbi:DUF1202 family protein [Kluyvera sichuanensis]|uniref:DUF1202 family protein n=1 Tax=Kluyvera sichuanensis TaxID=2725494 RepID=UPI0034A4F61C